MPLPNLRKLIRSRLLACLNLSAGINDRLGDVAKHMLEHHPEKSKQIVVIMTAQREIEETIRAFRNAL